jgi:hypothetical protein
VFVGSEMPTCESTICELRAVGDGSICVHDSTDHSLVDVNRGHQFLFELLNVVDSHPGSVSFSCRL